MFNKIKYILVLGLALSIFTVGCSKTVDPKSVVANKISNEPIKVGAIIMQTGVAAEYGTYQMEGIKLALEKIKKNGGVKGREIKMIYEDTKCDAKEGASAATKLINIDKVDLLLAFECSGPTVSAVPVAQSNKKPMLVALATAPKIASKGDYIFRLSPSDTAQGKDLAKAVSPEVYKQTAIVYTNNDYGVGIKNTFSNHYRGSVVASEAVAADAADFKAQLTKIKNTNPQAVLVVLAGKQYPIFFKQAQELGLKVAWFSTESFKDKKNLTKVGSYIEGLKLTSYSPADTDERKAFLEGMKKKYNKEPGTYADFGYDGIMVAAQVLEKALDKGGLSSDNIKSAMQSVYYKGATGITEFDDDGEVKEKPFTLYEVKNSDFVEVK